MLFDTVFEGSLGPKLGSYLQPHEAVNLARAMMTRGKAVDYLHASGIKESQKKVCSKWTFDLERNPEYVEAVGAHYFLCGLVSGILGVTTEQVNSWSKVLPSVDDLFGVFPECRDWCVCTTCLSYVDAHDEEQTPRQEAIGDKVFTTTDVESLDREVQGVWSITREQLSPGTLCGYYVSMVAVRAAAVVGHVLSSDLPAFIRDGRADFRVEYREIEGRPGVVVTWLEDVQAQANVKEWGVEVYGRFIPASRLASAVAHGWCRGTRRPCFRVMKDRGQDRLRDFDLSTMSEVWARTILKVIREHSGRLWSGDTKGAKTRAREERREVDDEVEAQMGFGSFLIGGSGSFDIIVDVLRLSVVAALGVCDEVSAEFLRSVNWALSRGVALKNAGLRGAVGLAAEVASISTELGMDPSSLHKVFALRQTDHGWTSELATQDRVETIIANAMSLPLDGTSALPLVECEPLQGRPGYEYLDEWFKSELAFTEFTGSGAFQIKYFKTSTWFQYKEARANSSFDGCFIYPPEGRLRGVAWFDQWTDRDSLKFNTADQVIAQMFVPGLSVKMVKALVGSIVGLILVRIFKGQLNPVSVFNLTTEHMRTGFTGIIEMLQTVALSLLELDGAAAFSAIRSWALGEEGKDLDEVLDEFAELKKSKESGLERMHRASKIKEKLLEKKKIFVLSGRTEYVKFVDEQVAKVIEFRDAAHKAFKDASIKTQPLCLVAYGDARSGKSTIPIAVAAALGSLWDCSTAAALEQRFVPSTGSQYFEGFNNHAHVHYDEFGSIARDYDVNVGATAGQFLDLCSAVVSRMNMAFDDKGKVTSESIKVVSACTNSEPEVLLSLYTKPMAFLGRAFFVRVFPDKRFVRGGRFDPLLVPEKGPVAMSEAFRYEVKRGYKASDHSEVAWIEVGVFSYPEFVRWIVSSLAKAELGSTAEVRDDFVGLADLRVDRVTGRGVWIGERTQKLALKPEARTDDLFNYKDPMPPVTTLTEEQERKQRTASTVRAAFLREVTKTAADRLISTKDKSTRAAALRVLKGTRFGELLGEEVQAQMFRRRFERAKRDTMQFFKVLPFSSCWSAGVSHTTGIVVDTIMSKIDAALEILRARVKKLLTVVGLLAGAYGVYRVSRSRDNVVPQVLHPPRPFVPPPGVTEMGDDVREYMGQLYKVAAPAAAKPVFLPGSAALPVNGVAAIERAMLSLSFEVGDDRRSVSSGRVWGFVYGGFIVTVRHPVPAWAQWVVVEAQSAHVPMGVTKVKIRRSDICFVDDTDCMLLPNFHPAGGRSLDRLLKHTGVVRAGDTCYLLGTPLSERVSGTIRSVGEDIAYHAPDVGGERQPIRVASAVTYTLDGDLTRLGDCGRVLVAQDAIGTLTVVGFHFGVYETAKVCLAVRWDPGCTKDVTGPAQVIAQSVMNRVIDFVEPYDGGKIVPGVGKHGVMADPHAWASSNLVQIGVAPRQARNSKTTLEKDVCHDEAAHELDRIGSKFGPAAMSPVWRYDDEMGVNRVVNPYAAGLDYSMIGPGCVPLEHAAEVITGVCDHILPLLAGKKAGPVGLDAALAACGALKPVNLQTGAAMSRSGINGVNKKGGYVVIALDGRDEVVVAHDVLREETSALMARLIKGESPLGVGTLNLKDEVVKEAKVQQVNTRLINAVAMPELMVKRQIFGEFLTILYPILQKEFGMCFKVNVMGPDWKWVYERAVRVLGDRVGLSIDFKRYDKHHLLVALWLSFEILLRLLWSVWSGPPWMFIAAAAACWMEIRRVVCVDGTWVFAFLGGPSGSLFTIYFNCMCQLIYWWLTFRGTPYGRNRTFREFINDLVACWCSLGDDCAITLPGPMVSGRGLELVVEVMKTVCGQEMTGTGEKGELQAGSKVDFLKRGFRVVGERVFAPLPPAVVFKAFLYVDSKLTPAARRLRKGQLLRSMFLEAYMMEDRDRESVVAFLDLVSKKEGIPYEKMAYDDFLVLFDSGSASEWSTVTAQMGVPSLGDNKDSGRPGGGGCAGPFLHSALEPSRLEGAITLDRFQNHASTSVGRCVVRWAGSLSLTPSGQDRGWAWSPDPGVFRPAEQTNKTILAPPTVVETSGVAVTVHPDDEVYDTSGNTATLQVVSVTPDGYGRFPFQLGKQANPDDVFDRMYPIATLTWANGSTAELDIVPFQLWFNQTNVFQRMQYWGNVRFDLDLRFDISTDPYAMGMGRFSWRPLASLRESGWITGSTSSKLGESASALGVDIDPSTPGPKELLLPWRHPHVFLRTTEANSVLTEMGTLRFTPFVPLAKVNGKTGDLTITIRARAVNLRRGAPTYVPVLAQMGPVADGAKLVGSMASALATVPAVAPMASIAGAISNAVYKVADYFGWSRPEVKEVIASFVRPVAYTATADKDATLFVGPMRGGLYGDPTYVSRAEEDEMSIKFLTQRIGYLRTQALPTAAGTVFGEMEVLPLLSAGIASGSDYVSGDKLCPTPLAYATYPFGAWRGSLTFTFKVVCSNYHAGSIRISYDPAPPALGGSAPTSSQIDSMQNCVLEVKPGASVEITVGFQEPMGWLRTTSVFVPAGSTLARGWQNGRFFMSILNPITAPTVSDIAYVLVYVRGGHDYEVAMPRDFPVAYKQNLAPPALMAEELGEVTAQAAFMMNEAAVAKCVFGVPLEREGIMKDHILGRGVESYRALLKRYTFVGFYNGMNNNASSETKTAYSVNCLHETGWGGAINVSVNQAPNTTTLSTAASGITSFRWLKNIFTGHRGGAHWRVRVTNRNRAGTEFPALPVYRATTGFALNDAQGTTTSSTAAEPLPNGPCEIVQEHNLEYADFHIPDFGVFSFTPGGAYRPSNGSGYAFWGLDITRGPTTDVTGYYYACSKAIAEDFSFLGFAFIPSMQV